MTDEAMKIRIEQSIKYSDHLASQHSDLKAAIKDIVETQFINDDTFYRHAVKMGELENQISAQNEVISKLQYTISTLIASINEYKKFKEKIEDFIEANSIFVQNIQSVTDSHKSMIRQLRDADLQSYRDLVSFINNRITESEKKQNDNFEAFKKTVPESPEYVEDLKSKINNHIEMSNIKTDQALDKATHTEMLYRALERRTREPSR